MHRAQAACLLESAQSRMYSHLPDTGSFTLDHHPDALRHWLVGREYRVGGGTLHVASWHNPSLPSRGIRPMVHQQRWLKIVARMRGVKRCKGASATKLVFTYLPVQVVDATALVSHPDQKPTFRSKNRMHFLGSKITFSKSGESLVNYGEFSESGRFRQKSRNGR